MTPPVIKVMRRLKVVDHPSPRSSHLTPTVRGGGLSVMVAALAALALPSASRPSDCIMLSISATGLGLLGLTEDLRGVSLLGRLGIQTTIAIICAPLLLRGLRGSAIWLVVTGMFTAAWLVAFVNAFNFMDGINGIAIGQVIVAGVAWFLIGSIQHVQLLGTAGPAIAGAAFGFVFFNFPRARVFLGDVGSYFLGAWLSVVVVLGLKAGIPAEAMVAPLGVSLLDTGSTLVRRAFNGETWYRPHRSHVYQRLVRLGWSHTHTTLFAVSLMAICSALGEVSLTSSLSARVTADIALAALLAAYLITPRYIGERCRGTP